MPAPLELADVESVRVGQTVLAFGSPFGLDGTLTQGIVSARRDLPTGGGRPDRGRHPDRRHHQPRQLGWPAGEHAR
jgi:S1-C subfamily serine protease